jgi:hypothetical protein
MYIQKSHNEVTKQLLEPASTHTFTKEPNLKEAQTAVPAGALERAEKNQEGKGLVTSAPSSEPAGINIHKILQHPLKVSSTELGKLISEPAETDPNSTLGSESEVKKSKPDQQPQEPKVPSSNTPVELHEQNTTGSGKAPSPKRRKRSKIPAGNYSFL